MDDNTDSVLKHIYIQNTTLSLRVINALRRVGIGTLYDLSKYTEFDLLGFRNFGANLY